MSSAEPVVAALTLLIASVGVALLLRWTAHVWPVTVAALAVWGLALVIAWISGVSTPEVRPWAALVLAAVGAVALVPALLVAATLGCGGRLPWSAPWPSGPLSDWPLHPGWTRS